MIKPGFSNIALDELGAQDVPELRKPTNPSWSLMNLFRRPDASFVEIAQNEFDSELLDADDRVQKKGKVKCGIGFLLVVVIVIGICVATQRENGQVFSKQQPGLHNSSNAPTKMPVSDPTTVPSYASTPKPTTTAPSYASTPKPTTTVPTRQATHPPTTVPTETESPTMDPTSQSPTVARSESPTVPKTTDNARLDPYEVANISDNSVSHWESFFERMVELVVKRVLKIEFTDDATAEKFRQDDIHDSFCQKENSQEQDAHGNVNNSFGVDESSAPTPGLNFNIEDMQAAIKGRISMLCRFYKPTDGYCDLSSKVYPRPKILGFNVSMPAEQDAHEQSLKLHAWRFARRIVYGETFRVGILGTSVLSGQDNCYASTYAPGLKRDLEQVFSLMGVKVEVRSAAQNGDGATMYNSLMCTDALFKLDEMDTIHQFWSMTVPTSASRFEYVVRNHWMQRKWPVLPFFLDQESFMLPSRHYKDGDAKIMLGYLRNGYLGSVDPDKRLHKVYLLHKDQEHGGTAFPDKIVSEHNVLRWYSTTHWGRHGDGRCHIRTREDWDGVFMQNWHPGPAKNQVYRDQIMFFYLQAIFMALQDIKGALDQGVDLKSNWNQHPSIDLPKPRNYPLSCDTDVLSSPQCDQLVSPAPFCTTGQQGSWNTASNLTKWRLSDDSVPFPELRGDEENWKYGMVKRKSDLRGCLDIDKARYNDMPSCHAHNDVGFGYVPLKSGVWISFKIPALQLGKVLVCTSGTKGSRSPYHKLPLSGFEARQDNQPVAISQSTDGKWAFEGRAESCILISTSFPKNRDFVLSFRHMNDTSRKLQVHAIIGL